MFHLARKVEKNWRCSSWEKDNLILLSEFKYGQTWKISLSPLSLSLYSTFKIKENYLNLCHYSNTIFFLLGTFTILFFPSAFLAPHKKKKNKKMRKNFIKNDSWPTKKLKYKSNLNVLYKSTHWQRFYKIRFIKTFAKFTENHLSRSLFLINL